MKYDFPLVSTYVAEWTILDALREFGANAYDAETATSKAIITYDARKETISFKNPHTTLDRKVLLLGGTTKQDNGRTVGHYGEGMKIGFLVLARAGHKITVYNGSREKWLPAMYTSAKWRDSILRLEVVEGQRASDDFEILVSNIREETWNEFKMLFLRLWPCEHTLKTEEGSILGDLAFSGRIYCKGVFIAKREGYALGYDLPNLRLNRDRKSSEDFDAHIAATWNEVSDSETEQITKFYKLLSESTPEAEAVSWHLDSSLSTMMKQQFLKEYPDCCIARSPEEVRGFTAMGLTGVMVSAPLYRILSRVMPTYNSYRSSRRFNEKRSYSANELTMLERLNVAAVLDLYEKVYKKPAFKIEVCDFVDGLVIGCPLGEVHKLSRRVLSSPGNMLMHLLSEYCREEDGKSSYEVYSNAVAQAVNELLECTRRSV